MPFSNIEIKAYTNNNNNLQTNKYKGYILFHISKCLMKSLQNSNFYIKVCLQVYYI